MVTCSGCCPIWTCWRSPSGFGLSWTFLSGGSRLTRRHLLASSGFSSFGSCSLEMCKVAFLRFLFISAKYAYFSSISYELHGEDGSCYNRSYPVEGRSSYNRIVGRVMIDDQPSYFRAPPVLWVPNGDP
ncbi:hypothetical protein PIB30_024426 [Stylosanthes scabra]|uniref:Uncharacterized protein n=1 Tax=Stylosanthes scabra TaxID=79078 RepID=A0ABU6V9M0_9FABA|nr:hypothetical protein [Stylosanthes scabra]